MSRRKRTGGRKRNQDSRKARSRAHRIGIDISAAVTQGGGIGRYTRELVQELSRPGRVNDDFSYHLFSAKRPVALPVADPIPHHEHVRYTESRLSARWLYRVWYRLDLPWPVQRYTGDIHLFHSPDFVLPPVSGAIPTLLTVHDLSFIHYPETFTPALLRFLHKHVLRSVHKATHVLADSEATCADLKTLWDIPAEKITVLYSGVNARFRPITEQRQLQQVKEKYGLGNSPYLLSVGTLQPRKNYPMLIRAYRTVADNWPHTLAIAGGKGWLYEETIAEVQQQALQDRVHFLDFVDDDDLPALYSGATLFLFPSLYEGFGLPPLEAMASGVPVIASDASCLPEVVGQAALKLPPQDERAWKEAIHLLLLDDARRSRMVAAGFLRARAFTWARAANQLRDIYRSLLAN